MTETECNDERVATAPPAEEGRDDPRLQRILDLCQESLSESDALTANVGVIASELAHMASSLGPAILAALNNASDPAELKDLSFPAVNDYLRIVKQFERFASFKQRRERESRSD